MALVGSLTDGVLADAILIATALSDIYLSEHGGISISMVFVSVGFASLAQLLYTHTN